MSNKLASAEGERWFARQAGAEPTPYTQEDLLLIASAQHGGLGCISEGGAKRCQSMFVAAGFVSALQANHCQRWNLVSPQMAL